MHWDRGISAGEILSILNNKLCGNGKPFHKILIFFDEFGRFIEYTAANPLIAGDASFQQIFEAVQNANGNIIFVGLIQKELKTYTLCIDKTSNFIRYIDRFKNSEEVYLSDVMYVALEGQPAVVLPDMRVALAAGQVLAVPAGMLHAVEGDGPFKILQIAVC